MLNHLFIFINSALLIRKTHDRFIRLRKLLIVCYVQITQQQIQIEVVIQAVIQLLAKVSAKVVDA